LDGSAEEKIEDIHPEYEKWKISNEEKLDSRFKSSVANNYMSHLS
tara:strand:- start:248 stop:382 length:135 start_codon:yes stop_codon:yes gene_type:complete